MAYKYFGRQRLPPPLVKPITSKSHDVPAVNHSQKAPPTGIADTDTNKRHIFTCAFYLFLFLHFCILSILSILSVLSILSRFSAEIALQALVLAEG